MLLSSAGERLAVSGSPVAPEYRVRAGLSRRILNGWPFGVQRKVNREGGFRWLPGGAPSVGTSCSQGQEVCVNMRTDSFLSPPPECIHRGHAAALAEHSRTFVRVTHGAHDDFFPVAGKSVASLRKALATAFGIPTDALPMIGGRVVGPDRVLAAGDELLFAKKKGHKGVGTQVWTEEEFCKFFKITLEDLNAWIAQGLRTKPCLDGSLRITETAVDEFFQGSQVPSPYLTAEQAAHYLRTTVKGIYSLLERRKLRKLPGSRTVLFTPDLLDAYVRGGEQ